MKRIFAVALLIAFLTGTGYAQGLRFGLKAGTDVHKIDGISFSDKFTFGYHIGAFAEIGLNKTFSIQPEVYFSQMSVDTGRRFSDVYQFSKIPKMKFGYINIPLLLNFKPSSAFALQVGPQFGILVDNNLSLLQNGKDAFKDGDISGVVGAQVAFSKIRIYGRYVVGISDMNAIDDKDSWKTQTIHIGLGFSL